MGDKSVPHLKIKPFIWLRFMRINLNRLRNKNRSNLLILIKKVVDCKSAHAGSIPASASTFKAP